VTPPFLDHHGDGEADELAVEAVQYDRQRGKDNGHFLDHRPWSGVEHLADVNRRSTSGVSGDHVSFPLSEVRQS
jgi:hypothetical protein